MGQNNPLPQREPTGKEKNGRRINKENRGKTTRHRNRDRKNERKDRVL